MRLSLITLKISSENFIDKYYWRKPINCRAKKYLEFFDSVQCYETVFYKGITIAVVVVVVVVAFVLFHKRTVEIKERTV